MSLFQYSKFERKGHSLSGCFKSNVNWGMAAAWELTLTQFPETNDVIFAAIYWAWNI